MRRPEDESDMIIAIVIGALLGYLIGGPIGLLIGGGLGYWLIQRLKKSVIGKLAGAQAQFLESTFAVMGCMCKADGQVTEDELEASRKLWDRLRLTEAQRAKAREDFNRGKSADFDLEAELAKVRGVVGSQRALLQVFLQVQLAAIAADGQLHPAEHEMLLRVARGLGCSEAEIAQIEAMLRGGAGADGAAEGPSLEDSYRVLGVEEDVSDAELKKCYRRLMSQHHPDKLVAKGLPEEMVADATAKTQQIKAAYELIRKSRGR